MQNLLDQESLSSNLEDYVQYSVSQGILTSLSYLYGKWKEYQILSSTKQNHNNSYETNQRLNDLRKGLQLFDLDIVNIMATNHAMIEDFAYKHRIRELICIDHFRFDEASFRAKITIEIPDPSRFIKEYKIFKVTRPGIKRESQRNVPNWINIIPVLLSLGIDIRRLKQKFNDVYDSTLSDTCKRMAISQYFIDDLKLELYKQNTPYNQNNLAEYGIPYNMFYGLKSFAKVDNRPTAYDRLEKVFEIEDMLGENEVIERYFLGNAAG